MDHNNRSRRTTRDLSGDEQELFDRLVTETSTRLQRAPYPTRARAVPNPKFKPEHASTGDTVAFLLGMFVLSVLVSSGAVFAWRIGRHADGFILFGAVLVGVLFAGTHAVRTVRAEQASGWGSTLRVPSVVAGAYESFTATVEAISRIVLPLGVSPYLDAASAHMDRLLVQAHRLHVERLSNSAPGEAVRDQMVQVAAETSALVDVLLGNPDNRAEAIGWQLADAARLAHPQVDEGNAIGSAFDAYHRAVATRRD